MSNKRKVILRTAAVTAMLLPALNYPSTIASATEPDRIEPAATGKPVALYISICLWSQQHPSETCREVPLTPGAAGPLFATMKACQDGQQEALRKWRTEAGPVFGFTAMAGDGYRIDGMRCGPIASRFQDSDD
jgi:hypothetical protein